MKRALAVILGVCIVFCVCACKKNENQNTNADLKNTENVQTGEENKNEQCSEGSFVLNGDFYEDAEQKKVNEKTAELIGKAKDILNSAGQECAFDNVQISSKNDEWNFRELYVVQTTQNDKKVCVSFRKDNLNLVRIDSGAVVSSGDGKNQYTSDMADNVIAAARKYYAALPLERGYELSNYQMDFGGADWQIDFSKKLDVKNYDKPVYNYAQNIRMRIAGSDGKLLSLTVFDTPVKSEETDKEQITYEQALNAAGLDESKLKESYIGCYTIRDKGYARLCWCLVYDYSSEYGVCDERSVYVDLYTGLQIGLETC